VRRQRFDAFGQLHRRHLGVHRRALARIDHQGVLAVLGKGRAQAFEQDAAKGDVRVRHHRHEAHTGMCEEAAQPVCLVQRSGA